MYTDPQPCFRDTFILSDFPLKNVFCVQVNGVAEPRRDGSQVPVEVHQEPQDSSRRYHHGLELR